jgi:hypothetical protein
MGTVILIIVGILTLLIAIILLKFLFVGAVTLLNWASEQGFVGVAVYIACWVFLLPVMVAACIISGALSWWANR